MKNKTKISRCLICACIALIYCIGVVSGLWISRFSHKQKNNAPEAVEAFGPEAPVNILTTSPDDKTFSNKLQEIIYSKYPGVKLAFYVKDLNTDNPPVVYNDGVKMNSASIIKLYIMACVYDDIAHSGTVLTAEEENHLNKMITESNNQSANYFIDKYGGENENHFVTKNNKINKFISNLGFADNITVLERKMHDYLPPYGSTGFQNYTSAKAVGVLYEKMYKGQLVSPEADKKMLDLLKKQKRRNKIPSGLEKKYPSVEVWNKTGELSQVENDAAFIVGEGVNVIFVVMINDIPLGEDGKANPDAKEEIQQLIGDMGVAVFENYK